jgi:hypothetical protein
VIETITTGSGGPATVPSEHFVFPFGISVFFPAFNDAPSLPSLLERTFDVLQRCARDYEVVVVNDGSADHTGEVLEELRQRYAPHLRVITHQQNRGYGGALRSGFAAATKDWVFYTDGDGQYDPLELEILLRAVTPTTGLVNGYKITRNDPWHRIAIGWLYNRFARTLFRIKLRDIDCDFRLIRRSLLDQCPLESTSGTICVELVRKLECQNADVVEVPVHHYARQHGRSQFFRVRSLATTFFQLCRLFMNLVVLQALRAPREVATVSRTFVAATLLAITAIATIMYARSLTLPLISDDYLQVTLARKYGPVESWPALAADALYRCRATSLLITHWTEQWLGVDAWVLNISSLLLHILNAFLVFALGAWRVVGWRVAAIASVFFAACLHHHEAVVWYAALPELLVFFFGMASFLFWLRWLETGRAVALASSLGLFILALFSKESAVVVTALFALALLIEERRISRRWLALVPAALLSVLYFGLAYAARNTHQHFNDGTFELSAPFLATILRSVTRMLWVWGGVSLIVLFAWKVKYRFAIMALAFGWMAITLLPYSFLTYMSRVPSRHTYFATVGLSLLVGAAFLELWRRMSLRRMRWVPAAVAAVILLHQTAYFSLVKYHQFDLRALPTELMTQVLALDRPAVYIKCFPFSTGLVEDIRAVKFPNQKTPDVYFLPAEGALDLCNKVAHAQ